MRRAWVAAVVLPGLLAGGCGEKPPLGVSAPDAAARPDTGPPPDPACPAPGRCEPAGDGILGVLVPANSGGCPPGYGPDILAMGDHVTAGPCAGCTCSHAPAVCSGTLYAWDTNDFEACNTAPIGTGGAGPTVTTEQPCQTPFGTDPFHFDSPAGYRLGTLSLELRPCTARGEPAAPPAALAGGPRFCALRSPATCSDGSTCVANTFPARRRCRLLPGQVACPPGTVNEGGTYYLGIDDQRRCGRCTCGAPTGGGCAGVVAAIGDDTECRDFFYVAQNTTQCLRRPRYAPGIRLEGEPTLGTCLASVTTEGDAVPADPHTLCCAESTP